MQLIRVVLINIKKQMKNPSMLLMTVIFPVAMLLIMNFGGSGESGGEIVVIDNSKSSYSNELIQKLSDEYTVSTFDGEVEEHLDSIRENKVGAIYVIDSDFQKLIENNKMPKIKCYKSEATSGAIMAGDIISKYVMGVAKEEVSKGLSENAIVTNIENENIQNKDDYKLNVTMICYFMMIGGSIITTEIIKLKEQKVLKRTIATNNSDMDILGGLFLSSFILQGVLSSIAFLIVTILVKTPNVNIPQGILIIFLSSLVTTAIVLAVTRWIKNATIASLFTVILALATFGLGIFGSELESFNNVPEVITNLSVISPFTWFLKIINTGEIVIPTLIVILMSLVFFTAGSFRLREFVKE